MKGDRVTRRSPVIILNSDRPEQSEQSEQSEQPLSQFDLMGVGRQLVKNGCINLAYQSGLD